MKEMEVPTRSEIQAMVQRSRERIDAAVAGVDDDTLESLAVCGVWNARDVAGHLADWNDELIAAAEHALGGPAPDGQPIEDGEAYNESHAAARASQSWAQAKGDLDGSIERIAAFLVGLDEGQLSTAATPPWGGEATVGELIADTAGHMDEHVAGLEQGLPAAAARSTAG
jgi:hypothetical protein